jgi:hypothetical protein
LKKIRLMAVISRRYDRNVIRGGRDCQETYCKQPPGTPWSWEDNINMDFEEMGHEGDGWL